MILLLHVISWKSLPLYLPERTTHELPEASTKNQWIEGKDVFSFSVMGLIIKHIQTFRDVGFAGALHFLKVSTIHLF